MAKVLSEKEVERTKQEFLRALEKAKDQGGVRCMCFAVMHEDGATSTAELGVMNVVKVCLASIGYDIIEDLPIPYDDCVRFLVNDIEEVLRIGRFNVTEKEVKED